MNDIVKALILVAVVGSGCQPPSLAQTAPSLVAKSHDDMQSAPGPRAPICGYQMQKHTFKPEQRPETCWQQQGEYYCKGCKEERRIQCHLTPPTEAKAGQPLRFKVQLFNISKAMLAIDQYGTPFGAIPMPTNVYVRCDGNDEPYHPRGEAHWQPRGKRDRSRYLRISPGAGGGFVGEFDLQDGYPWARGACLVHWNGVLWDVIDAEHPPSSDAADNPVVVDCNWAFIRIEP